MDESPAAVAIVVVTHQGPDGPIGACLESLHRHRSPEVVRTIVVDNGATTRPETHGDDAYGPGCYTVIRTPNLGYGAALNTGFTAVVPSVPGTDGTINGTTSAEVPFVPGTDGTLVVGLNDDVTVSAGWLGPLVAAIREPNVGAVQPKLLYAETGAVNSVGVVIDPDGSGRDIGHGEPDSGWTSGPIDVFTGGAVMFSERFLDDLGGFDERYFLYYEDVDLALRGTERRWTYRCEVDSVVHHRGGATTSSLGDDLRRLQERNRLWTALRFGDAATIRRSCWLSIRRLRHHPRRAHLIGLVQGVAAAPRILRARRRGQGAT